MGEEEKEEMKEAIEQILVNYGVPFTDFLSDRLIEYFEEWREEHELSE